MKIDFSEIENWYWAGLYEPNNIDPLDETAIRTLLRTRSIVGVNASKIQLHDSSTAATDLNNIFIPYCMFDFKTIRNDLSNSFYDYECDNLTNKEYFMIMLSYMNTYMIHEYNHILYTKELPKSKSTQENFIFNVIEDMFINHVSMQTQSSIFFKLFYKIHYSKDMVQEFNYLKNKLLVQNEGDNGLIAKFFLDSLLTLNFKYIIEGYDSKFEFELPKFLSGNSKLKQLLGDFTYKFDKLFESNFSYRYGIVKSAIDFLNELLPNNNKNSNFTSPNTIDGDGNSLPNSNSYHETHKMDFKRMFDNILGLEKIEDNKNDKMVLEGLLGGRATKLEIVDIMSLIPSNYSRKIDIKPNAKMLEFGKYMRYQWGVNRDKIRPHKDGEKISKKNLVNAGINGKIFTKGRDIKTQLVKPQSVFVVDLSGSMGSFAYEVMESVKAMSLSMQKMGIRHSIWGHTTLSSNDNPVLYLIYSYNMRDISGKVVSHNDFDERINKINFVNQKGNEDYIVIENIVKYFDKGTRNLFMLSDGKPSPTRISNGGVKYTQKAITDLRKRGVNVYSMSLKSEVVKDNDEIYGKKYNFRAYDNLLNKALQDISSQLAQNK